MTAEATHAKHAPPVILVVDDDAQVLHAIGGILRERGFEPILEDSGEGALARLESARPDLILLDIGMPEMDGYQVCRSVRANRTLGDVPVVFVTAHSSDQDRKMAFAVGGSGFIVKPFERLVFVTAIEGFLSGTHTRMGLSSQERQGGKGGGEPPQTDPVPHRLCGVARRVHAGGEARPVPGARGGRGAL